MSAHEAVDPWVVLGILALAAFLPPLVFLSWVRKDERHHREPMAAVVRTFLYGATAGILLALVLTMVFDVGYPEVGRRFGVDQVFFATVVGAPFAEELAKGLTLGISRRRRWELEDGIVYGVAVGLGFAATENLVYGIDALVAGDVDLAVATLVVRVFSSMLLHAGASGLLGFGYALVLRRGGIAAEVLPYYLVAVLLHAAFNFLVQYHDLIGLVLAVVMAVVVVASLRQRIRVLDALPHD